MERCGPAPDRRKQTAGSHQGIDVRYPIRVDRVALARRPTGAIRDLQGPLARKPNRARRCDVRSTPSRPDAVVPLCLPRRHVRLLRHDGERHPALDLPHARVERGQGRPPRDRAARESAHHQGFGCRHAPLLRQVAAGEGRVRAVADAQRGDRAHQAGQRGAHRRRRRHRMHQLRDMLCRLRYRALEFRLSRAGGAQSRVDARERRPRCWQCRASPGRRRKRRLPRLPLAPVLPRALPPAPQSDRLDRGSQAPHHVGLSQGRDMNVGLYVWQRATAALMVPLVLVHVVVIFYATRKGMTAADILARTRGSIAWASFYGAFVVAVAIHAGIGVRNVLTEWSPLKERSAGIFASAFGLLLLLLGVRAVAAVMHRLSGLALAIFLPLHFLTLGLAIQGEAPLESFLRWSDQPLVKLAESGLVFLLMVHMLGGLRLLVIENLDWRDEQKELATIAAGLSAVIAFILLARLF